MSETTTEGTESPAVRAFWHTDYKRYASVIREARKAHGDDVADAIAHPIVTALAADNPEFDSARFLSGTYQIPPYVGQLTSALKAGVHARCKPWTPAEEGKVAKVTQLAAELAETLSGTIPHFVTETFMASVKPPQPKSSGDPDDDDEDEDEDEDDDDL